MIRTKGDNNGGRKHPQHKPEPHSTKEQGYPPRHNSTNPNFHLSPYYGKPPKEHQFKPGQSGNPAGRPSRKFLTQELIKQLLEKNPKTGQPKFIEFIKVQIDKACNGKLPGSGSVAAMIMERVEGLLKQKLEMSGFVGHVHTTVGELLSLAKLTDPELLLAEKLGLKALAVAEREAAAQEAGDAQ